MTDIAIASKTRKKQTVYKDRKLIAVMLPIPLLAELDNLGERLELSRTDLFRKLLGKAVADHGGKPGLDRRPFVRRTMQLPVE